MSHSDDHEDAARPQRSPSAQAFGMRLRKVPAKRGALWLRQGFAVFFARPLAYAGLMGVLLLGMLMLHTVPWIGPLLLLACLPLVSLGFMLATQQVLRGETPTPDVLLRALRIDPGRRMALLRLGGLYMGGVLLIMLLCHVLDGGRLMALQQALAGLTDAEQVNRVLQAHLEDPALRWGLWSRLGLNLLLSALFWHAPALVHWGAQTAAKSLFFSAIGMWRSKGAFVVYGLSCVGLLMGTGLVCSLAMAALGLPPQSAGLALLPMMLMLASAFYASLFFTFADTFELTAPGSPPAPPPS